MLLMLVAVAAMFGGRAKADTFTLTFLDSDQARFFYGMDDSGHVVINVSAYCVRDCYEVFTNGVRVPGTVSSPPVLSYDNGTPCSPAVPAGTNLLHGVCNGSLDAFTGYLPGGHFPGVYFGPPSSLTTVSGFGEGFVFMNSLGDIVYDDHFSESWMLATRVPDPVPEPSSFVLLGTGVLAAVGVVRRRLRG